MATHIIVGGVAGGATTAARVRRLDEMVQVANFLDTADSVTLNLV